jgi:predicted ATP-grasp superfamily ATP-dependent carboligase
MRYIITNGTFDKIYSYKTQLNKLKYKLININRKTPILNTSNLIVIVSDIDTILRYTPNQYHDIITALYYKDKFAKFMYEHNLGNLIPNTYFSDPVSFPCIMKPINGIIGRDISIFTCQEEYDTSNLKYDSRYIIQEYIFSTDLVIAHVLFINGKIILDIVYTNKIPTTYYIKKGSITNYIRRNLTNLELSIFNNMLNIMQYHGVCCIDYTYDSLGNLKIYEINPRFGGSLIDNKEDLFMFLEKI